MSDGEKKHISKLKIFRAADFNYARNKEENVTLWEEGSYFGEPNKGVNEFHSPFLFSFTQF